MSLAAPPANVGQRAPRWWLSARAQSIAAWVALASIALAVVVPVALRSLTFSVYDEATHIDYAYQLVHGVIPATGDYLSSAVLDAWGCYGTQYYFEPNCTVGAGPESYPNGGWQYNAWHPPVYYAITGVLGSAIGAITGLDFVTSYRLTGALWLFAGMAVLMLALRNLGVDRWLAFSIAGMGGLWWTSIVAVVSVTNDAPALLIGASVLFVIAKIARGHVPWVLMAMLGAFAASTKVMSSLGVLSLAGACVLMAIVPGWKSPGVARWKLWAGAGGIVAAVAAVYVGWEKFQAPRTDPGWENPLSSGVVVYESPLDEWASTMFDGFFATGHNIADDRVADGHIVYILVPLLGCALIAAFAAAIVRSTKFSALRTIVLAAFAGLMVWPTLVQMQVYGSRDDPVFFPEPTGRYGFTVLVLLFGALALLPRRPRTRIALATAAAGYIVAMLVSVWLGGT